MKTKNIFLLVFLLLTFSSESIWPQNKSLDSTSNNSKKFDDSSYPNSGPISKLPDNIPIYNNKIYLYADFENIVDQDISVFIINNTQDSFKYNGLLLPLLQQEFKDTNSIWKRSQFYEYGSCSRGYLFDAVVRPGEFEVVKKTLTKVGEKHEIRFNFFNTPIVASNSGTGYINP